MKVFTQHVMHGDRNVTLCGLDVPRDSPLYAYRVGTPRPVRDWLRPCRRCTAALARNTAPVSP